MFASAKGKQQEQVRKLQCQTTFLEYLYTNQIVWTMSVPAATQANGVGSHRGQICFNC